MTDFDNLLSKSHCESDAAWETYCRAPAQSTWQLYVDAKRREAEIESVVRAARTKQEVQP